MTHVSYVNGRYLPHAHAMVHIEDRGYQFADGIYEVMALMRGVLIDEVPHLERLERSACELEIPLPMARAALRCVLREVLARNTRSDGTLYMQVTRGVARRDHGFPKVLPRPSLVVTLSGPKFPKPVECEKGVAVVTAPDIRWGRCDIKSVGLLPNILAKQQAAKAGVRETWLHRNGVVTEGSASNAFIVTKDGTVRTHPVSGAILNGIVRQALQRMANEAGVRIEERAFTLEEALGAAEAFLTSTTAGALPIVTIDGKPVGDGMPGPITRRLMAAYRTHVEALIGEDA